MTAKNCLNCGNEIDLIAEDYSDGVSIHCPIYDCGSCGAKISVMIPTGEPA